MLGHRPSIEGEPGACPKAGRIGRPPPPHGVFTPPSNVLWSGHDRPHPLRPPPTGLLHIGGARTALFNWLFARHHGGKFLLRIEDTDRERTTAAAIAGDPRRPALARPAAGTSDAVFQFARAARHAEVAHAAAGRRPRLSLLLHARGADGDARAAPVGRGPAAALRRPLARPRPGRGAGRRHARRSACKAPREGETVVDDLVQGEVRVANAELDDMIILRSDGTPTYMLAVVVDDHDMGDHPCHPRRRPPDQRLPPDPDLSRRWAGTLPRFAHIPLIHGADGAKLSKRHGAGVVLEFREQGYPARGAVQLPAAARLGPWRRRDLVDRDEAIALFDLDGVGRAASRMDYAKLDQPQRRLAAPAPMTTADARTVLRAAGRSAAGSALDAVAGGRIRGADAGAEGAGEDAGRTRRQRRLPRAPRAAADRAEGAARC